MKKSALCVSLVFCLTLLPQKNFSQSNEKILKSIKELETNLKALIQEETLERKLALAQVAAQLKMLSGESDAVQTTSNASMAEEPHGKSDTKKLISKLKAGNERFVSDRLGKKEFGKQRVALANGQQPYTVILTCSDSRVPPEYIFDESLGQLFIIRVAGNVVDSVALGSIEYAAEHLHAHLIVIMGHSACGAVKATITGGVLPPNIASLARRIQPAVDRVKMKQMKEMETIASAVKENVYEQMQQTLHQSVILHELMEKNEIAIIGAVYNIESGKVEFLSNEHHE